MNARIKIPCKVSLNMHNTLMKFHTCMEFSKLQYTERTTSCNMINKLSNNNKYTLLVIKKTILVNTVATLVLMLKKITMNFFLARKVQCVSSLSVILIIFWDALMCLQINSMNYFVVGSYFHSQIKIYNVVGDIAYCLVFVFFPIFGLLADIKTGRYNTIIAGVYLSFVSWIICGVATILKTFMNVDILYLVVLGVVYILEVIGYCCFRSNIIQFNFDQLIGASADKLSAVIYWHSLSILIVYVIDNVGKCLIKQYVIVSYVISGVALCIVIVSNFLFKHWLDTPPNIINPVKLICKVVNYARRNKYPKNRSALTYWEEDYPSRLDLGKEKYGGPFSEEEVENVKTVLRLIPLFISMVGLMCAHELKNHHVSYEISQFISCFIFYDSLYFSIAILFILLSLSQIFRKCIPSMLRRIGLGLVFTLTVELYYVIMFACKDYFQLNTMSYKAIIIPDILYGVSFALILPTSLEFTIAQSPHEMRGLMVGLWFAAFAIGYALGITGKFLLKCKGNIICQSLSYYVYIIVLVLIILIVFLVLAKCYKLRVRENEVNIHVIAEEHYERYIEQEVEYRREMGLSMTSEFTD